MEYEILSVHHIISLLFNSMPNYIGSLTIIDICSNMSHKLSGLEMWTIISGQKKKKKYALLISIIHRLF